MNKLFFTISILCICLTSCNQSNNKQIESNIIDFDNLSDSEFEIKDIEYIPLETKEYCLLGDINKIIYKNDKFYILDRDQNKGVYIFDKDGKFISSINKQGEGAGEYIEIIDMDVDNENNIYVADNAQSNIIKYAQADPDNYEVIHVGEHFLEFCYLDKQSFILRDVFGPEGQKMKLACFNHTKNTVTSILDRKYKNINEMDIMRCSKHYLYRSNGQIYYNERFTPTIYSISPKGELIDQYTIFTKYYISEDGLKELEKNPGKFIQETDHVKDIISLYENEEYFVCMPFITPSATYVLIPKNKALQTKKIDLMNEMALQGTSQIEGVAKNKFFVLMNYSEPQAKLQKDNSKLKSWNEESNPVLVLFSIK